MHDLVAFAHLHGQIDDRVVAGLTVNFSQQNVGLVLGEEAAAGNRRSWPGSPSTRIGVPKLIRSRPSASSTIEHSSMMISAAWQAGFAG
jgi:hypothetical protein